MPGCGELLVERYGLTAKVQLDGNRCPKCAHATPIIRWEAPSTARAAASEGAMTELVHRFRGAVQSIHVEQDRESPVAFQFIDAEDRPVGEPSASSCTRFMISKAYPTAIGVRMQHVAGVVPRLYEVYDRAHFPTVDVATAISPSDERPFPIHTKAAPP